MKQRSLVQLSFIILAALILSGLPGGPAAQAAPAATLTVSNLNDSGAGSLRQAVLDAASGDTINFSVTGTIGLTSGQILINKNLTITGPGASSLTVAGGGLDRVFEIAAGATVSISGLTIAHGLTAAEGGGIKNSGTLTVSSSTISGNEANDGGGIYNASGALTVSNSTVADGSADDHGGGIYNDSGTVDVTGSTLSNNSATLDGGGIYNNPGGTLTVSNSTFDGNTATNYGGGIYTASSKPGSVSNSTFSGNLALYGGGIFNATGALAVSDSTLDGNTATGAGAGGGICNDFSGALTVSHSTFSDNTAPGGNGGGIYNGNGTATVSNSTLSHNSAAIGGGLSNYYWSGMLTVTNSTLTANSATSHGGGIYNYGGIANVSQSIVWANTADSKGGGIYNHSPLTVSKSQISGNSATSDGGGIYNDDATMTVSNSSIALNSAGNYGGGFFERENRGATLINTTVSGNLAQEGGGIYINASSTVTLINSTLSGNSATSGSGGGVLNRNMLNYVNTIIANSNGSDCKNFDTIGTNTNNLVEDNTCSPAYSGDPKLGAMVGGVYVPPGDSPVIDAGHAATCAAAPVSGVDQRGQARDDLQCDIGAVEVKLSDTHTITKIVSGAGTYTFGPTLVRIVVTAPGSLSQLMAQHHSGDHPNATRMNGQWWEITPTGIGFTANLDLPHTVSPDTDAKVCKHVSGNTWDCDRTGSSATRVWRDGLTAFSDWAVGDNVGPNAVTLRGFAAQAGGGFPGAAAWAALIGVGLWAAFRRRHPAPAGQAGGAAVRTAGSPVSRPAATAYAPPAVVHETALAVRAGAPLGVPLLPDWPDPAGPQK